MPRAGAAHRRRRRRARGAWRGARRPRSLPSVERLLRAAAGAQQIEADRGLVREQRQEVHVPEGERPVDRPVEHLEDADRLARRRERHRHERPWARSPSPRRRCCAKRGIRRRDRRSRSAGRVTSTQPAMPVVDGNRIADEILSPSPETASNTSSSVSSSSRNTDAALASKIARATSTIDCSSARCPSSEAERPDRGRRAVASRRVMPCSSRVVGREVEDALELERRQLRVLREDERRHPGDVRCGEAVARAPHRAAADPRDVEVDPACEELDRRDRGSRTTSADRRPRGSRPRSTEEKRHG